MKKIALVLFLVFAVSGLCFAQTASTVSATTTTSTTQVAQPAVVKKDLPKVEVITGKIISIDLKNNTIVVKEGKAAAEKTVAVDANDITSLKTGENVKVLVKEGSNVAVSVKEIYRKHKTAKQ